MPLPRWVEVFMYGRRKLPPKPIPQAEFEEWRAQKDAERVAQNARLRTTVDSTCEIVLDLKKCVSEVAAPARKNHAPNGAH